MVEVVVALELAQQDMLNVLDAIPVSQRDAMPARGGWTITAIVEHLAIIEDGAGRLLSNLIKQVKDTPETETDAIEPTLESTSSCGIPRVASKRRILSARKVSCL